MKRVVQARGVGKRYQLRHRGAYNYVALRDVLTDGAARLIRRATGKAQGASRKEDLWALRNVDFDLHEGDRLGLIGRNGAGKSTLLKILSRITEPSEGEIRLTGRVASLLEVGTGFHPELTGRENVFLNGTILGMRRSEIQRRFDEIVAFAEVERFLDTPVKRYSSGMYVRLAFAVAAHLEQEVLLVDEVLAVGDAAFQRKCLTKMGEVARAGRTIVLVSHNLIAIEQLCTSALWLDGGTIASAGPTADVIAAYHDSISGPSMGAFDADQVSGDGTVELLAYAVSNGTGDSTVPLTGDDVVISVQLRVGKPILRPVMGINVTAPNGAMLLSITSQAAGQELPAWEPGEHTLTFRLHEVPYLPGTHRVDIWAMRAGGEMLARADSTIAFEVGQRPLYGTSQVDQGFGSVYTPIDFSSEALSSRPSEAGGPGAR